MKPYLLRNNDQQHRERLALVRHYSRLRGRPVFYADILHELQHEKFLSLPKD